MEAHGIIGKTILMVEDSDEDFQAARRIFSQSGYDLRLERAANVEQALDFLRRGGAAETRGRRGAVPALILLDLNLPGTDGRDFLLQLKRDERYREIPVVILTTSNNPRDVLYCYRHGANGYQIKPVGFEKFRGSINSMLAYWFAAATIPATIN